jgi:hypothetical protein
MALTNFPLLCASDAVDYILDGVMGGDSTPRNRRLAIKAVQDAYAEVPMRGTGSTITGTSPS